MITAATAFSALPAGLRDPLVAEYQTIVQNFMEHRWLPTELSGGRFSEIVYTILDGHAKGTYAAAPSKPGNFVLACRALENNGNVSRSFQILIPRLLPALYEIRNNRNVGHVGGDVDSNHMDAVAVLSMCNWIMGELLRVFHGLDIAEAQKVVDALAEMRAPAVWTDGTTKRVLHAELSLPDQLLLLIGTTLPDVTTTQLQEWTEAPNLPYFRKIIRGFHSKRWIELDAATEKIRILPPGAKQVQAILQKRTPAVG